MTDEPDWDDPAVQDQWCAEVRGHVNGNALYAVRIYRRGRRPTSAGGSIRSKRDAERAAHALWQTLRA